MSHKESNSDKNTFKVSENYFEELEKSILAKTQGNEYHLPMGIEHPFTVPAGYFEALEKTAQKIPSSAFHLTNDIALPYRAPDGYLDSIDEKIDQRISNQTNPFIILWKKNQRMISIAASVLLIALFGLLYFNGSNYSLLGDQDISLQEFDTETLVAYLEDQDLSSSEIATAFDEQESFTSETSSENFEELTDEDLLQLIDIQLVNDIQ